MSSVSASNRFEATILATFGDIGSRWLANLPGVLEQTADMLELRMYPPFPNVTYNYVAPAMCGNGIEVVLKLGVPNAGLTSEIRALRRFAGLGCAHILFADPDAGILLLERLVPGIPLTDLANDCTDSKAISIACTVMRRLHRNRNDKEDDLSEFETVSDLGQGYQRLRREFNGAVGPFPQKLVEEAERLWMDLDTSAAERILLHGDLHHDNIISAAREPWLAIDPKGYVGDPAFETGALLRNLWQDRHSIRNPAQTIKHRVYQFAEELDLDRERVRGWGLTQAVLSVWWSYEDGDPNWADLLGIAEIIAGIRCQ